ncbi:MAG: hypothetical protein Q4C78_04460 [Synergistaceae bacterium]|nr:hypothetical protein [Synergistaceae bacterium]
MWIVFAFISIIFYALGEVFQKKGSDFEGEHSELKILIWFGICSGIVSLAINLLGLKSSITALQMLKIHPAILLSSTFYYVSLLLCFFAFKLVPVSIASPVTCMDGVFTFIGIIVLYLIIGKSSILYESITSLKLVLVILISIGVYASTLIQTRKEDTEENKKLAKGMFLLNNGRFAIIGVILTLLSAVLDAFSSLTDIYFLGEVPVSWDYIYIHGMMLFGFSVILYVLLWILEKKPYKIFAKMELPKVMGAGFDSLGTIFYMIAVAGNQIYTNVIISSFCVFTVLLSRIILKEKIEKSQAVWIGLTVSCIILFTAANEIF